jgi:hypothetical protein
MVDESGKVMATPNSAMSVLKQAILKRDYIVIHTISGLVYAGRALGYDPDFKLVTLEYRNASEIKTTDVCLPNILSVQLTTVEKIDKMRNDKKAGKRP